MSHQDWSPVIFNKNIKPSSRTIVQKKGDTSINDSIKKIDNDSENFSLPLIPNLLSKEITTARVTLKKTQKEMANKLMIQENIYKDLENGKALYSGQTKQHVNKLERILNVKFENKTLLKIT